MIHLLHSLSVFLFRYFVYICLMEIEKLVDEILKEARASNTNFWVVCDKYLSPEQKYYLWSKINESEALSAIIQEHCNYLSAIEKTQTEAQNNEISRQAKKLTVEKIVSLRHTKKVYKYIYPTDADGNIVYKEELAQKVIVSETEEIKERYIKPEAAIILHALNQKSNSNYSTGLITSVVNAVKALHLNEISEATFISIISAMPISEEIKSQIIAENTQKTEGSVFTVVAWGEKEINQKLQKENENNL